MHAPPASGGLPIQLNGYLYLHHPATERWNLGQEIRDTVRAYCVGSRN